MKGYLCKLGDFKFTARNLPLLSMGESIKPEYRRTRLCNGKINTQFLGFESEINLECVHYPELFGGMDNISKLRNMAQSGSPYVFSCTEKKVGQFFGLWFITSLEIEKERLFVSGEPRKIAFSISLAKDT